ncbi:MAG: hypothetical protein ACHQIM_17765 [Sphingobacteriales bacterium]
MRFLLISLFLMLAAVPVFVFFGSFLSSKRNRKYLLKNGIPTLARIVSIQKTTIEYIKDNIAWQLWEIVLEVENPVATTAPITIQHEFEASKVPKVGDKLNVLIDPKKLNNIMLSPN